MSNSMVERLQKFFTEENNIRLAFLMGSFAKGTARKDSDVDVAVLFDQHPASREIFELKDSLTVLLKKEIDLIVLNNAGPVIRMQALKSGILLYKTPDSYEDFFTRTINEYDDLKYFRKSIEEKILGGRLYA